jgi:predicted nucleic acid binding AN1-type Zn finger protein
MDPILFDLSNIYSPSITSKNVVVESKRTMPKKCECSGCNKKLMLTDLQCKCNKYFCMSHRYATEHKCDYDYKTEGLKNLENNLVKVESNKVSKI